MRLGPADRRPGTQSAAMAASVGQAIGMLDVVPALVTTYLKHCKNVPYRKDESLCKISFVASEHQGQGASRNVGAR